MVSGGNHLCHAGEYPCSRYSAVIMVIGDSNQVLIIMVCINVIVTARVALMGQARIPSLRT